MFKCLSLSCSLCWQRLSYNKHKQWKPGAPAMCSLGLRSRDTGGGCCYRCNRAFWQAAGSLFPLLFPPLDGVIIRLLCPQQSAR